MLTTFKIDISFTYVDEIRPQNETPGSCDLSEELFLRLFKLKFEDCELLSSTKKSKNYIIEFKTSKSYQEFIQDIQLIRFKVKGKLAKVADMIVINIKEE